MPNTGFNPRLHNDFLEFIHKNVRNCHFKAFNCELITVVNIIVIEYLFKQNNLKMSPQAV